VNDPGVLPCRWPQNAATGSFTPALVVSPVVVVRAQHVPDERAARVHMIVSKFAGTKQSVIRSQIGFARGNLSRKNVACGESDFAPDTIASLILAPCSTSSTLFAPLRPGRRPGLRALTTPPRGTCLALTRWWFV